MCGGNAAAGAVVGDAAARLLATLLSVLTRVAAVAGPAADHAMLSYSWLHYWLSFAACWRRAVRDSRLSGPPSLAAVVNTGVGRHKPL